MDQSLTKASRTGILREGTLTLAGGRTLSFAELGAPEGRPLFYFHGFPGSRLQLCFADALLRERGIRVIAPERPGCGLSDSLRGRRLLDWPADVASLATFLRIENFAVLGCSGGGPYAVACAHALPERVTALLLVSALGPVALPEARSTMPALLRVLWSLIPYVYWSTGPNQYANALLVRHMPSWLLWLLKRFTPPADFRAMSDVAFRTQLGDDALETFRKGLSGPLWDLKLLATPWGFRLEQLRVPTFLFHGCKDTNVPIALAKYQADAIPKCRATYFPEEGHLLFANQLAACLDALSHADADR